MSTQARHIEIYGHDLDGARLAIDSHTADDIVAIAIITRKGQGLQGQLARYRDISDDLDPTIAQILTDIAKDMVTR